MDGAVNSCNTVLHKAKEILVSRKNAKGHWHMAAGLIVTGPASKTLLCVASGTRCSPPIPNEQAPFTLRDCHAEVLARRAFNFGLMSAASSPSLPPWLSPCLPSGTAATPGTLPSPAPAGTGSQQFTWNSDFKLELVISDAPCGDAAVRAAPCIHRAAKEGFKPTGAKPLLAPQLKHEGQGAQDTSFRERDAAKTAAHRTYVLAHSLQLGAMRSKAARSDLRAAAASDCVACSDKVASWINTGMSSALLAGCVGPVPLSCITVCADDEELGTADSGEAASAAATQLPNRVWAYALAVHRALIQRQPAYISAWRAGAGAGAAAVPWEAASRAGAAAPPLRQQVCALPFVHVEESADGVLLRTQLPPLPGAAEDTGNGGLDLHTAVLPANALPDIAITAQRFSYGRHTVCSTTSSAGTTPECFNLLTSALQGDAPDSIELLHSSKGLQLGATKSTPLHKVASRLSSLGMYRAYRAACLQGAVPLDEALDCTAYASAKLCALPGYAQAKRQWKEHSSVFSQWPSSHEQRKAWSLASVLRTQAQWQAAAELQRQAKHGRRGAQKRARQEEGQ